MDNAVEEVSARPSVRTLDERTVVCDLYDVFREARMNVKYYGRVLAQYQKWNLGIEVAIALGTSGTLLALPFFSSAVGKTFAISLGTIAAVLGVLKPVLNLPKKIERASKLWSGYLSTFTAAQRLVRQAGTRKQIDSDFHDGVEALHDKMDALGTEDDPSPSGAILEKLQDEVIVEYPVDRFWCPPKAEAVT